MQRVEQPIEKVERIAGLRNAEPSPRCIADLLQELVRRDLGLERARVPELAVEHPEPLDQLGSPVPLERARRPVRAGLRMEDKVVAQRGDVQQGLEDDVHERIVFDVVETDIARQVRLFGEVVRRLGRGIERAQLVAGEGGREQVFDVVERRVIDLVSVG